MPGTFPYPHRQPGQQRSPFYHHGKEVTVTKASQDMDPDLSIDPMAKSVKNDDTKLRMKLLKLPYL